MITLETPKYKHPLVVLTAFLIAILWGMLTPAIIEAASTAAPDRSQAYYHFMIATLKERSRHYSEAIEEYRLALQYDPKASEILSRLADLYIQTDRVGEAIQEAQKALEKDPQNKEAHQLLGQIYMERIQMRDSNRQDVLLAIQEFEAVRQLDPEDETAVLALGQLYLQNQQPQSSVDILSQYVKEHPDSESAMLTLSTAYQELGQYDEAISVLLKYLEVNPNNLYTVQQIAELYTKAGKPEEALEFQKRAYEGNPSSITNLRRYLDLLIKTGEEEQAIRILHSQIEQEPGKMDWVLMLSRTYQRAGMLEKAESLLLEQLQTKPDNPELLLGLVQVYEDSGRYQDAMTQLEKMLKIMDGTQNLSRSEQASNSALIYSHMGYATYRMKEYDRSLEYYKKAREFVQPDEYGRIDFHIALNYLAQKKYDLAIETTQSIIKTSREDVDAWELLGAIYEEMGKYQESDQISDRLIEMHPESPFYYIRRAERLQQREQYRESIEYLKKLMTRFPSNDQILFLLGAAHERLKELTDAEEYFLQAIEANPRNANALNYLGYMLVDHGLRLNESIEYIKRALEFDQNNGAYLDSLGWAYFKLDQLDLAEENLRQAWTQMQENPVVNDHMGDLSFKQGKFRDAIRYWETALKNKSSEVDPSIIEKKIEDTKRRIQ